MYDFLRGQLVEVQEGQAVLDVQGVGYLLFVPPNISVSLQKEVTLYTSFIVREQAHALFGFLQKEQRELFNRLVALSGIGPKTALGLVGHLGIEGISRAVSNESAATLAKVPGIGRKTAERLIIELKGKLVVSASCKGSSGEAVSALVTLGYSEQAAYKALLLAEKELGGSTDVSALISTALRLSKALT